MNEITLIITIAQFLLLLTGSIWAYFRIWKEGIYRPKIEFTVECNSYGPQDGNYIVEFLVVIHNKGLINQKFYGITLKVRGIGVDEKVTYWADHEPRIAFPVKFFETQFIYKEKYSFIFVEPGVRQILTYVTKIPVTHNLVLVQSSFKYEKYKPHSIERVFNLNPTKSI